jgi:hypothetical protein
LIDSQIEYLLALGVGRRHCAKIPTSLMPPSVALM